MDETQKYFIDVLKIVPTNSFIYIQSPHNEILSVLNSMKPRKDGVYTVVQLTNQNRDLLIEATKEKHIQDFIHSLEIRFEDKLIFEGWDGMDYGEISKTIPLTQEFMKNYIEGQMCIISSSW
jgi:hypothetical protein